MHVTQQKEKHRDGLREAELGEGLLQEELEEGGAPHEHAGGEREPLVVGDGLVLRVPASVHVYYMSQ